MSRPRQKPRRLRNRRSSREDASPPDATTFEGDPSGRTLPPRPAEQILIDALGDIPAGSILCTSWGRGQFAVAAAQTQPSSHVRCCFLDLYALEQAQRQHPQPPLNLCLECAADFPEGPFDAFVLPVSAAGEAELVRDCLQSGHQRLREGGTFFASTDNRSDVWLHGELRKMFAKVTRREEKLGTLFKAIKTEPLKKMKNFECQLAFRDGERLIHAVSRPGVFSHRRVDDGARALVRAATLEARQHVLELGCGSGVVSLAAALRAPDVRVLAIDSNPRAVECTLRGAQLNEIANLEARLSTADSASSSDIPNRAFDLVVANPPYYSNFRIAEVFAGCAARALTQSGAALFVAKRTDWYTEQLPRWFAQITTEPIGNYVIVRAQAPLIS